ncbi:MAG: HAD family hydrolase [Candidatus Bathyarchaeia archaeon]
MVSNLAGVKAVLFDLFDTLLLIEHDEGSVKVNEECLRNVWKFLSENGVNVSYGDFIQAYSEVRDQLYERIHRSFEEPHFAFRVSQSLAKLGYTYAPTSHIAIGAANAYSEEFIRHVRPDKDAAFVLQSLVKHGYKTGVISNFAIPECVHELLTIYGLKDFLGVVIISAEVNRRKPSPEIFFAALNALGVEASNSVFVGDTPDIDVRGAKKAGMKTILVQRKNVSVISTEDTPDFKVNNLREILEILLE